MNKATFLIVLLLPLLIYSQDSFKENHFKLTNPLKEEKPIKNFTVLDAGINTIYNEEGGVFYKDKFIISSTRKIGAFTKKDELTNQPYSKLYCMDIAHNGELKRPLLFSSRLNAKNAHIGSVAFTPDEETVYFTKSNSKNNFQLYKAQLDSKKLGKWENIELVEMVLNKPYLDIKDLYINPEGNLLYFSCNSAKGYGGYDLYVAEILADRTIYSPLNLGKNINSKGDERSPYLSTDKKYFYFSSSGHTSIGGLDIFKSKIVHHQYSKPINLGIEINSPKDDFNFTKANNRIAYFSSNRNGGKGQTDIYKAIITEALQDLSGYALDKKTNIILPNTSVKLKDLEGKLIASTKTNEYGFYQFDKIVSQETYTLTVEKEGYYTLNSPFYAKLTKNYSYRENFLLHSASPEIIKVDDYLVINLEKIYFNFDRWELKDESKISLDKVATILKKNPNYQLKIIAHTDNRGDNEYNLLLSQKRANATLEYLTRKGISKVRLTAIGKGESKLLIDCGQECSEEQHQANRRIEFLITNK